jgi:hypothetical protein
MDAVVREVCHPVVLPDSLTFAQYVYQNALSSKNVLFISWSSLEDDLVHVPSVARKLRKGASFICLRPPDTIRFPGAEDWHHREKLWEFRENPQAVGLLTEGFCSFLRKSLEKNEFASICTAKFVRVCYGGSFAVAGSSLRKLSRKSWKRLSDVLFENTSGETVSFMDRSWGLLLSNGISGSPNFSRRTVLDFKDDNGTHFPGLVYSRTKDVHAPQHLSKQYPPCAVLGHSADFSLASETLITQHLTNEGREMLLF